MRTYQRLVIAKGGANLSRQNPAYPHNFIIYNEESHTLKIGSTGTRYNSLHEIETSVPEEFSHHTPIMESILSEEPVIELPQETAWSAKKTNSRKKKKEPADDSTDVPTDAS